MLLVLTDWLSTVHSGFSVFQYLTLRAILGALTALAISLVVGPFVIRRLSTSRIGQTVRGDGPRSHLAKTGTPTMGGALILIAISASVLLWANLDNRYVWVVLLVTLLFGVIGWIDDYRKLVRGDPKGLPAKQKYFWQSAIGLGCAVFLYHTAQLPAETQLIVPFFQERHIRSRLGLRGAHVLRHCRGQQRRESHRRPGRPRDSPDRDGSGCARHLRVRHRTRQLLELPGFSPTSWVLGRSSSCAARSLAPVSDSCGSTPTPLRYSWAT